MGMIINIAEALKNRADYNLLREPINDMLTKKQEAWEQKNPIDLLFHRGTLNQFQTTYTSSIGFQHAFAETGDYAVAPIFNTHEGFSKVYTSRTFQGGFIITQQVLEDQQYNTVKNTANQFMTRWHGDQVEYAMKAIQSGFGKVVTFGNESNGGESKLLLTSADTVDGDVMNATKNPLFSAFHTTVKRKNVAALEQTNFFYVDGGIDLDGTDTGKIAKLADVINLVITEMENYKDDNGKYVAMSGAKTIVAPNDARLTAMLQTALDTPTFNEMGQKLGSNSAYKRATLETTPYLRDLECCMKDGKGVGFFIVDKAYNAENNGPEFTQRIALTMNVEEKRNPYGISYDARERFDINAASWRGIAYVYIGSETPTFFSIPKSDGTKVTTLAGLGAKAKLTPMQTLVKPISVVGTVSTKEVTGS